MNRSEWLYKEPLGELHTTLTRYIIYWPLNDRKVYLVTRKSDGKHVATKEIPIDDLPKVEEAVSIEWGL